MRHIFSIFIVTLLAVADLNAADQLYEQKEYPYPVESVVHSFSGSFGEMRTNHRHSGIDIRTDGVVGKRVVSIDDGYISRISLSSGGFGLALYVAHPNGTTSVYAHLLSLTEPLDSYLTSERYRLKQHSVNLYPAKDQFPVARGEMIALAGNSGSSNGPHLHFEIRNSKLQKPLNPVKMGIITSVDKIAPKLDMLYYVEVDKSSNGVERQQIQRHPLRKDKSGVYRLTRTKEMWVGRNGYFVLACSDRMEGSYSVFGLYSLDGEIGGKHFYQFKQDGFTFDVTRYVNALSYYPYQLDHRGEVYQMRRQPGAPTSLFTTLHNDGVINIAAGAKELVTITATDHSGNSSKVQFTIRGKGDSDIFKSSQPKPKEVIPYSNPSSFKRTGLRVEFVKGGVYRNYEFKAKRTEESIELAEGVRKISDIYTILSRETPLHRPMTVAISCDIADSLQSKALIVHRNHKGSLSPLKSSYKGGELSALSSTTGDHFAVIDTLAPTVEGSEIGGEKITFTVKDNFSGVAAYSATLNGEWIALDRSGSTISHTFRSTPSGTKCEVELTIEDLSGNKTTLIKEFVR